jgi:hypothetical protein
MGTQGLMAMSALTLAALIAIACAVGALVVWRVGRRVKQLVAQTRRRVDELHTRFLPPGPRRETAVLRQRLAREVRSTRETLTQPGGRIFQADSATVLLEITSAATALDAALSRIERFPSPAQQRTALATVRPQVEQLIETSYSARHTMLRATAADRERHLTALSESVAHEAAAFAAYEKANRELSI